MVLFKFKGLYSLSLICGTSALILFVTRQDNRTTVICLKSENSIIQQVPSLTSSALFKASSTSLVICPSSGCSCDPKATRLPLMISTLAVTWKSAKHGRVQRKGLQIQYQYKTTQTTKTKSGSIRKYFSQNDKNLFKYTLHILFK